MGVKDWVGSYLCSAMKEKLRDRLSFATAMMILTFIIALAGCIMSLVALTRDQHFDPTQQIQVNGVLYCKVRT
jgi:gluconate kinase